MAHASTKQLALTTGTQTRNLLQIRYLSEIKKRALIGLLALHIPKKSKFFRQ
jgi:hypothetical protein